MTLLFKEYFSETGDIYQGCKVYEATILHQLHVLNIKYRSNQKRNMQIVQKYATGYFSFCLFFF